MKRTALCLFLTVALAAAVVPCLAADAGPVAAAPAVSPLTQSVLDVLDRTVWPLCAGLVTSLLGLALTKLSKKWGGDLLLQQHDLLEAVALQGLAFAEERASAALAHKGVTLGGSDKMNLAAEHVLSAVPAISREQAERVIESLLARTVGVGATGDAAIGAGTALAVSAPAVSTAVA